MIKQWPFQQLFQMKIRACNHHLTILTTVPERNIINKKVSYPK